MSDRSSIEWTQATWNPTTGCDRTSPGCDHCYALTLAKRLKAMGNPKYQNDGIGPDVRPRIRADAASRSTRPPPSLDQPARGIRQLNERSVPQGRSAQLHPRRVRRHG